MRILHYISPNNVDFYQEWVDSLKDNKARIRILRRVDRIALGNFGDHKACRDGIFELRIDYGPGYRIYYFKDGQDVVLLLCGGDKRTQSRDIERAVKYKNDFCRRLEENE